jgi:transglutaminase-like putative cysteine protease
MRIQVSHETVYRYGRPVNGLIQMLRLTPRNHTGQYVVNWRIDVSESCHIYEHEDAFGNITHVLTADGELSELHLLVDGEVEMQDTHGVVAGQVERFPAALFLRETPLTQPDAAILDFARELHDAAGGDILNTLHALMAQLHSGMTYDTKATRVTTTAAEAFVQKRGVCQDFTHVFIAAARSLDIPARYIGGHFRRSDGALEQKAGHAWAEALVPDLGWIAFDSTNGICATEAHVRVAVGLDYLSAAPVRGSRTGGGSEALDVTVRVNQAQDQRQS